VAERIDRDNVLGLVDIPGQIGTVEDAHGLAQPLGLLEVTGEGSWPVGELKAGAGGKGDDVRAVPVSIGDEGDPRRPADFGEVGRSREISVGHGDLDDSAGPQVGDPRLDGTVQSSAGFPDHECSFLPGPVGYLGVVTDNGDGKWMGRADDTVGHGPGQVGALASIEGKVQSVLRLGESLHRNQDSTGPELQGVSR
jgi:hypothetical protein